MITMTKGDGRDRRNVPTTLQFTHIDRITFCLLALVECSVCTLVQVVKGTPALAIVEHYAETDIDLLAL